MSEKFNLEEMTKEYFEKQKYFNSIKKIENSNSFCIKFKKNKRTYDIIIFLTCMEEFKTKEEFIKYFENNMKLVNDWFSMTNEEIKNIKYD